MASGKGKNARRYLKGDWRIMASPEVDCEYDCPHCGQGYSFDTNAIYADDIADDCKRICQKCGGKYQLRCVAVAIELEVVKANE